MPLIPVTQVLSTDCDRRVAVCRTGWLYYLLYQLWQSDSEILSSLSHAYMWRLVQRR